MRRYVLGIVVILFVAAGAWQRHQILAWWHVCGLLQADDAGREACVRRVVDLDEAAAPGLVAALVLEDAQTCGNVRAALVALAGKWGPHDERTARLLDDLRRTFADLSVPGKGAALATAAVALGGSTADVPAHVASTAAALSHAGQPIGVLRLEVLELAAALLEHRVAGPWRDSCRQLALVGLAEEAPAARIAALRLLLHSPLREDRALLDRALPLLGDASAEVRRAALAALGPMPEVLTEEDLLPLLHDADHEVRRVCELALRGRGLQDSHIVLARLISDADPTVRLQVCLELRGAEGIDAGVWLRRLSQDPSPAVRAAVIRTAAQQKADLGDRLAEMQRQDSSATVRQLAAYYSNLESAQ